MNSSKEARIQSQVFESPRILDGDIYSLSQVIQWSANERVDNHDRPAQGMASFVRIHYAGDGFDYHRIWVIPEIPLAPEQFQRALYNDIRAQAALHEIQIPYDIRPEAQQAAIEYGDKKIIVADEGYLYAGLTSEWQRRGLRPVLAPEIQNLQVLSGMHNPYHLGEKPSESTVRVAHDAQAQTVMQLRDILHPQQATGVSRLVSSKFINLPVVATNQPPYSLRHTTSGIAA